MGLKNLSIFQLQKPCKNDVRLLEMVQYKVWMVKKGKRGEREVVCGQVWWPILGICPLHLTHPSAHSQQWTHTWNRCGTWNTHLENVYYKYIYIYIFHLFWFAFLYLFIFFKELQANGNHLVEWPLNFYVIYLLSDIYFHFIPTFMFWELLKHHGIFWIKVRMLRMHHLLHCFIFPFVCPDLN